MQLSESLEFFGIQIVTLVIINLLIQKKSLQTFEFLQGEEHTPSNYEFEFQIPSQLVKVLKMHFIARHSVQPEQHFDSLNLSNDARTNRTNEFTCDKKLRNLCTFLLWLRCAASFSCSSVVARAIFKHTKHRPQTEMVSSTFHCGLLFMDQFYC